MYPDIVIDSPILYQFGLIGHFGLLKTFNITFHFISFLSLSLSDRMRTGRAYDHEGLVAEHFMHARDMLVELLAVMFNRAMCEGLSLGTIVLL